MAKRTETIIIQRRGDKSDCEYGSISKMTVKEILQEINRDHSEQWTDYDETDWREGMKEWTDYRIFTPRQTEYVVRANVWQTSPKGGYALRIYGDEGGTYTEWHSDDGVSAKERANGLAFATRYSLGDAFEVAEMLNSKPWAQREGLKFLVYPAKEVK